LDEGCEEPGPGPNGETEPFPWWILSVIGVIILVVLVILWLYFKRSGQELTWENLKDKWSFDDFLGKGKDKDK
jgi:hypothetical protein